MGISIGLVGLGAFGSAFARLFKAHPLVDRIGLCDCEESKVLQFSEDPFMKDKVSPKDLYTNLDDICKSDLDALVIITQPWLHAPQCIQALNSGKAVYSAVPVIQVPDGDEILDWCHQLKEAVKRNGREYMLGETTVYHSQTMFCRRMANEGRFGKFVYAEGEYTHDLDAPCSLREVMQIRTTGVVGRDYNKIMDKYWSKNIKGGPMFYPTHSVSGPLAVMQAKALKVSAYGYRNQSKDSFFDGDEFSNISALFQMDNGAALRICEFRECGCLAMDRHEEETFRIVGTSGSFGQDIWEENKRTSENTAVRPIEHTKLTQEQMRDRLPEAVIHEFKKVMNLEHKKDMLTAAQDADFVPEGHGGSHPYLVNEFCFAVAENRKPSIDIDTASHYMAMGVAAHKSALKNGEIVEVTKI